MLTPRFRLEQDSVFLTVTIYAPFTHIDQTEIFMDGRDFRFSSAPYFLRLHLPGEVEETDAASGAWDAETTSFVVKCPKVTEGEHFEGLEMLTQLLTPKVRAPAISSSSNNILKCYPSTVISTQFISHIREHSEEVFFIFF